PSIKKESDGVLYLNPGSAGPRRFKLPITVAMLKISEEKVKAEIVDIVV
nr:YfcE family phosphodiesterase [Nitrosomonas sp.]